MKKYTTLFLSIICSLCFPLAIFAGPIGGGMSGGGSYAGAATCTNDVSTQCTLSATRSSDDSDFIAGNIKTGTNLLNVTGTYTGAEVVTGSTHPLAGASYSTTITTPGSAHTKSTPWTELEDSVPANTIGFLVFTLGGTASGVDYLFDVGIGAPSSETALVSDMMLQTNNVDAGNTADAYYFPYALSTGTRLSMRAQSTGVSSSFFADLITIQGTAAGETFTRFTTYGANTGTTRGTQIDPGAVADTKGSWVQVTASTTNPMRKMLVMLGTGSNTTNQGQAYKINIGTGAALSEVVLMSNLPARTDTNSDAIRPTKYEFPVTIAAGTRIAVQAQSSITDATDRVFDVVIIGLD